MDPRMFEDVFGISATGYNIFGATMNQFACGKQVSLAWSDFAREHSRPGTGNSYTTHSEEEVLRAVRGHWDCEEGCRRPGAGEGENMHRKVLVRLPPDQFFCPPRIKLQVGMPVQAEVVTRQEGEDPYVRTFVAMEDAVQWGYVPKKATIVDVVCYSKEALLENGGKRSSDADWEIVTILCSDGEEEPMLPLAMARNFLEMPGGSKGVYTAQQFAEAIYFHSRKDLMVK